MKNKITLTQLLTTVPGKAGSVLWLMIFLLPLCAAFSQNTWTQKANFGGGGRADAVGFSIGKKGYIGTGSDGAVGPPLMINMFRDFWEWDQVTDVWTQKASFGGTKRLKAVGFSLGNKGYIGTGQSSTSAPTFYKDFWEWDQATNSWVKKADYPGVRADAVGFSIGTKGYIGTGGNYQDFWEYDPAMDTWVQKADFLGGNRAYAVGFSIGTKGYIGTGYNISTYQITNDFWEWDQATNVWTQKADFGGGGRSDAVGFSIGTKGYIGVGNSVNGTPDDFWEWNQATNIWVQKAKFGGQGRESGVGFSIGCYGYIGTGGFAKFPPVHQDLWEYHDSISTSCGGCTATAVISSDPGSTVCVGQQVFISASGGTTYSWNTGVTAANIAVNPSVTTTYSVMITDASGCTGIGTLTVPVNPGCTATGISQFNAEALQVEVCPNPSNGKFRIQGSGLGIYNLDLYNVTGEKVHSDKILNPESQILNLDLPDGVYFLKLKTGDAIINTKIVIQE